MTASGCDLCGDAASELFLRARCHPTAPLRAVKDGASLTLRCYVPECDRVVAVLPLAEHPPDDGQPVTAEWLESAGWWLSVTRTVAAFEAGDLRVTAQLHDGVWHTFGRRVEGDCSLRCHTRGHVRRLLAALTIPPVEGPK